MKDILRFFYNNCSFFKKVNKKKPRFRTYQVSIDNDETIGRDGWGTVADSYGPIIT